MRFLLLTSILTVFWAHFSYGVFAGATAHEQKNGEIPVLVWDYYDGTGFVVSESGQISSTTALPNVYGTVGFEMAKDGDYLANIIDQDGQFCVGKFAPGWTLVKKACFEQGLNAGLGKTTHGKFLALGTAKQGANGFGIEFDSDLVPTGLDLSLTDFRSFFGTASGSGYFALFSYDARAFRIYSGSTMVRSIPSEGYSNSNALDEHGNFYFHVVSNSRNVVRVVKAGSQEDPHDIFVAPEGEALTAIFPSTAQPGVVYLVTQSGSPVTIMVRKLLTDRQMLDSSFGNQGIAKVTYDSQNCHGTDHITPFTDHKGRIVVPDFCSIDTSYLSRFLANGELDPSFGDHGLVKLNHPH